MNIFLLDEDPRKCAEYHVDKHVVKMILEYAQLLSTAHAILDNNGIQLEGLYKPTHKNHPCAIWVRESYHNYQMLYKLLKELCNEYTFRYGKIHKTSGLLDKLQYSPFNIPPVGCMTPPALAMPDEYKVESAKVTSAIGVNAIESYRNYYRNDKIKLHKWSNRTIPEWL